MSLKDNDYYSHINKYELKNNHVWSNSLMQSNKHTNSENKYFYHRMSCLQPPEENGFSKTNSVDKSPQPSESKQSTSRAEFSVDNIANNNVKMKKYHIEYPYKTIRHKTNNIFIWQVIKLGVLFIINTAIMIPFVIYLAVVASYSNCN